jgi:hypothetical protein
MKINVCLGFLGACLAACGAEDTQSDIDEMTHMKDTSASILAAAAVVSTFMAKEEGLVQTKQQLAEIAVAAAASRGGTLPKTKKRLRHRRKAQEIESFDEDLTEESDDEDTDKEGYDVTVQKERDLIFGGLVASKVKGNQGGSLFDMLNNGKLEDNGHSIGGGMDKDHLFDKIEEFFEKSIEEIHDHGDEKPPLFHHFSMPRFPHGTGPFGLGHHRGGRHRGGRHRGGRHRGGRHRHKGRLHGDRREDENSAAMNSTIPNKQSRCTDHPSSEACMKEARRQA